MDNTAQSPAPEYTGSATYSPEDNKLRLYIGRVPRPEYEKLRAEGWKALHKQREAGGGDFVATWTPQRRDTALAYAGIIEDEDMGPAERAADRAERFGGYREKRLGEATDRADRFDAGPSAHGFQSQARAERAAARHDRVAARAGDAWSKAEYWQRRTAGVISHALHVSSPSVRMGRIKELEADMRRMEQNPDLYPNWLPHTRLRLAYENQMLEAQGGRAGAIEIVPGGFFKGAQIYKVNKSSVSGRVVSVLVRVPRVEGYAYQITSPAGLPYSLMQCGVERAAPGSYRAPTPEELAAFEAARKAEKAARPKVSTPPLINPTDADAERLQASFNDAVRARWERHAKEKPYSYTPEFKAQTVLRITQARYSEHSKGTYANVSTRGVHAGPIMADRRREYYVGRDDGPDLGPIICEIRRTSGENYMADRVILLVDKPQKPLPAAVWEPYVAPVAAEAVTV